MALAVNVYVLASDASIADVLYAPTTATLVVTTIEDPVAVLPAASRTLCKHVYAVFCVAPETAKTLELCHALHVDPLSVEKL
jgi:hypothetical protein